MTDNQSLTCHVGEGEKVRDTIPCLASEYSPDKFCSVVPVQNPCHYMGPVDWMRFDTFMFHSPQAVDSPKNAAETPF